MFFEFYDIFFCLVGDMFDVVIKEMYDFKDKGDCYIVLCLEGMVGVVWVFVENKLYGLEFNKFYKVYYIGLMFCYEWL